MRAVWEQVKTDAREILNKVCKTWDLRWLAWAVSFILQEDHIEEMLCEQEKVMPNFASTDGCFICGICVCLCVYLKNWIVCATGYMITTIFMYGIKLYLILKTTNEYIIQNLKITLSFKLPVMFMMRQSTK